VLGAPLKTRVKDADDDAKFVRVSLPPPRGGEKKACGGNTCAGKRWVDAHDSFAALSARDGKKARIDDSKTREEKDDDVVVLVDREETEEKQKLLSSEGQKLLQRMCAL